MGLNKNVHDVHCTELNLNVFVCASCGYGTIIGHSISAPKRHSKEDKVLGNTKCDPGLIGGDKPWPEIASDGHVLAI